MRILEFMGKNSRNLTLKNVIFPLHHVSHYSTLITTHIVFYQVKFLLQEISHIKNKHWPFMTYINTTCYTEQNSYFVTQDYLVGTTYTYLFIKNVIYTN